MEENVYYVYLHKREYDDSIFYVGKGKGRRAFITRGRNYKWKQVVKHNDFYVEILFDNLSSEEALSLEIDVIKEIRYHFGEDSLTNLTDGGEGASGWKLPESAKDKLSDLNIYTFVHKSGDTFTGTRKQFAEKYSLAKTSLNHLFSSSTVHTILEWGILTDNESLDSCIYRINNARVDKRKDKIIHQFINKDSKEVKFSTREDMAKFLNVTAVHLGSLFSKSRPNKTVLNWGVVLENETLEEALSRVKSNSGICRSDLTVYKFLHENGDVFEGTRREFSIAFNLNLRKLNKMFTKKGSRKLFGWVVDRRNNEQ